MYESILCYVCYLCFKGRVNKMNLVVYFFKDVLVLIILYLYKILYFCMIYLIKFSFYILDIGNI